MNSASPPPTKLPSDDRKGVFARLCQRWQTLTSRQKRRLAGCFLFAAILTLAFIGELSSLMVYASRTELHSHIVLIPVISLYLLSMKSGQLPFEFETSRGWTGVFATAGFAFLAAGLHFSSAGQGLSVNDRHVLPVLAWLCLMAAGGFFFLGRKWMAAAAFPLCFLLFMIPLPDRVVEIMETASQVASAEAASWFFNLAGVPYFREGMIFDLPGISLQVAQECSGIRSSWVLFITGLVAAHLFLDSPWRRAVFVLLVIPLGILRNGFRILVIGWLCVEIGPHMIDHMIHRRGGPVFFALSLIPLFLILWWLRRGERRSAARQVRNLQIPEGSTTVG